MSSRAITVDVYEHILQCFRDDAPQYRIHSVAKAAGIDPKTARKAWDQGWPRKGWSPIESVIAKERTHAKELLVEEQTRLRTQEAQTRSDETKKTQAIIDQEAKIVNFARGAGLQGLAAIATMIPKARDLAEVARQQIEADCKRDEKDAFKLSASAALQLMDRMAKVADKLLDVAQKAMMMQRLHVGKPTSIVETRETGELTLAQATVRIEACQMAIAKVTDVGGGLTVIDGGLVEPVIGKRVRLV